MIRCWRVFHIALLTSSMSIISGCNIAGAAHALVRPDPVIEAKFHLANQPTVVLFDDYYSVVNPRRLRREIADEATVVLMEQADRDDMISPLDALNVAQRFDKPESRLRISEVGRRVGAGQVIYVEPIQFMIPRIAGTKAPMARFRIKVIDVETGRRMWPDEKDGGSNGWLITASLTRDEAVTYAQEGSGAASQALAVESGDAIARLFIDTHLSQQGNRLLGQ